MDPSPASKSKFNHWPCRTQFHVSNSEIQMNMGLHNLEMTNYEITTFTIIKKMKIRLFDWSTPMPYVYKICVYKSKSSKRYDTIFDNEKEKRERKNATSSQISNICCSSFRWRCWQPRLLSSWNWSLSVVSPWQLWIFSTVWCTPDRFLNCSDRRLWSTAARISLSTTPTVFYRATNLLSRLRFPAKSQLITHKHSFPTHS